jgi:hypothetical protein
MKSPLYSFCKPKKYIEGEKKDDRMRLFMFTAAASPGVLAEGEEEEGGGGGRTIRGPAKPIERCGPECAWYQWVPAGKA